MQIKKEHQINFWYVLAAMLAVMWLQQIFFEPSHIKTISYTDFQKAVEEGKIADVVIGNDQITGTYKPDGSDQKAPAQPQHFITERVPADLARYLGDKGVAVSGKPGPGLLQTVLSWILPSLGFLLLWVFLIRPMATGGAGGMMAIGKSKAKVFVERDIKTSFADVAGVDEAKDELKEVVAFLKDPGRYGRLGARIPKGVLLVGPPGTGKTLLARAVAGEAGVPFFSISGSEFVEMFVGVGAARVRDLFEQARQHAPAIVFIDELDALGRARGSFLPGGGGHDEKEQTLNQLLTEMDGFDASSGVVLLAATNRPEILDPALLRAGRFDRQVLVDRPDKSGRMQILTVHLQKIRLASGVPIEEIAALTPGFTGADIANLVNEAALLATRRNAESVTLDDFTQAIERIVAGLEKRNRLMNPYERNVVAHHEIGHALVAMSLPGVDPVQKVSIIPRGIGALGYTIQRPLEDRFLMNRAELMNRMVVLLGGRASELLSFNEISTGAADDLAKTTEIARSMVVRFGMNPELGNVVYEPEPTRLLGSPVSPEFQSRHYGEQTAEAIDTAVREFVATAFDQALAILTANRDLLNEAASQLLAQETLSGNDLQAIGAELVPVETAGTETQHRSHPGSRHTSEART